MDEAAPMTSEAHVEWFHGSPKRLSSLLAGSTVTPVITLARAFSHKPVNLSIEVIEDEDHGKRQVRILHDGTKHGYLYRVVVDKPEIDLMQHPDSYGAPGEKMLTVQVLPLEFMEEVTFQAVYQYTEEL
ncbi:MAG: hypothetical protein KAR44_10695 [Candidatus Aegiribacteria sp.]|nr:hypothetical protein [Candidatus Aegiribacteria sp.]